MAAGRLIDGFNNPYILKALLPGCVRLLVAHDAKRHVIHLEGKLVLLVDAWLNVGTVAFDQLVVLKFEAAIADEGDSWIQLSAPSMRAKELRCAA